MTRLHALALAILVMMASTPVALAQNPIPNPGFEDWTSGEPDHWLTTNIAVAGTITQSSDARSGISAIQGNVIEVFPGVTFPPSFQSENGRGFLVSQRYASLRAYLKFNPVDSEVVFITVLMMKDGVSIGGGVALDSTGQSVYEEMVVPINYGTSETPDTAVIICGMSSTAEGAPFNLGAWFRVDDFSFGPADTGGTSCPIVATGDANQVGGVNSTDIIYLANYVLKAGAVPLPCAAIGDANCDGAVNSTDIIYLVNFVLKGGPAPCDVCTLVPGTWACP
jgi:hypothetical protein